MMNTLRSLAQPFLQNGGSMAIVMDLWRTKDPTTLQRKIETYEAQVKEDAAKQQQQELQIEQQRLAQQAQLEQAKMENENMNKQLDREVEIQIAEIKALGFATETDVDNDSIPDVIETSKLALESSKLGYEQSFKERELQIKQHEVASKDKIAVEELKLKSKELDIKAQDSANKVKIAKANKNKYDKK